MIAFLFGGGLLAVALLVLLWAVNYPDKAEKVAGWIVSLVSKIYRKADRTAVALKVQGDINDARSGLLKSAPSGLIERKIKIKWTGAQEAETLLKGGEVLVCMEKADHHEQNVANALMAFLPKTMLPMARRYLDPSRMRAADLIMAKGLLYQDGSTLGALTVFFRDHLDPAREQGKDLREKIDEVDQVDLQGNLARLLLPEYLRLGEELHPGEPNPEVLREAEEFARWVHKISAREPGAELGSLNFKGRYFRIAVILVGTKTRLADEGLKPYRKRAKRYIYKEEYDAIYLMARDDNIIAVEKLAGNLDRDGLVASVSTYKFALRADFKKRYGLDSDRAIIACVRRRRVANVVAREAVDRELDDTDVDDLPEETWEATPPKIDQPLFDERNKPVAPEGEAERTGQENQATLKRSPGAS
jgi:hypothetical protein